MISELDSLQQTTPRVWRANCSQWNRATKGSKWYLWFPIGADRELSRLFWAESVRDHKALGFLQGHGVSQSRRLDAALLDCSICSNNTSEPRHWRCLSVVTIHVQSPGFHSQHQIKVSVLAHAWKFKVTLIYIVSSRPAWPMWDSISKLKQTMK